MSESEKSHGAVAVKVDGLSLSRGGRELFSNMTWELGAGQFLAVTGPSGAGKSSLLACLAGSLPPASGSVLKPASPRGSVGIVFQHLRLSAELSVLTNVLCGRLGRYPWWRTLIPFGRTDREEAFSIAAELGLAALANKPVKNISGGEQQRTALARTLFQQPELVLADEPTSDLDSGLAELALAKLRSLANDHGRTVICVMHDARLIERFADRELTIGEMGANGWTIRKTGASGN